MTKEEFLLYLIAQHRLGRETRFFGDYILLELITTPPLGYSIYEREAATA